jgi:hypothetical protein
MPINPVSASNAAVNSTQAVRPTRETEQAQRVNTTTASDAGNPTVEQAAPQPKPTINGRGETVGTRINITS